MTILSTRTWKTDEWVGKERMYPPPDWTGVSPRVIAKRGRAWNQDPASAPWPDLDGAEGKIKSQLTQGLISEEEAHLLTQWVTQGYFILEGAIDRADFHLIDEYVHDLDALWTADKELPGLQVMSLHIKGRAPGPIDHAEILSWPVEERPG